MLDCILNNDKVRMFIEDVLDFFTPVKPPLHAQLHRIYKDEETNKWGIMLY
jgi:hypothetical protein